MKKRKNIANRALIVALVWGVLFWVSIVCLFIKKISLYPRIAIIACFLILTVYGIFIGKKIYNESKE